MKRDLGLQRLRFVAVLSCILVSNVVSAGGEEVLVVTSDGYKVLMKQEDLRLSQTIRNMTKDCTGGGDLYLPFDYDVVGILSRFLQCTCENDVGVLVEEIDWDVLQCLLDVVEYLDVERFSETLIFATIIKAARFSDKKFSDLNRHVARKIGDGSVVVVTSDGDSSFFSKKESFIKRTGSAEFLSLGTGIIRLPCTSNILFLIEECFKLKNAHEIRIFIQRIKGDLLEDFLCAIEDLDIDDLLKAVCSGQKTINTGSRRRASPWSSSEPSERKKLRRRSSKKEWELGRKKDRMEKELKRSSYFIE